MIAMGLGYCGFDGNGEPLLPGGEGALALEAVAFFLVADAFAKVFFERWKEVERDVGGLEAFGFGVGDVVDEGAVGAGSGGGSGGLAGGELRGVDAGEQAGGDGLGVALDAGELAGDEEIGAGAKLEGFGEERRCVDIGIAMDLAVAEEGGVLEAGDHAQNAGLLAEFEVVLEADEVVGVGTEVLGAELDGGIRPSSGFWVREAGGLHGAETESVAAAAGGLFDGEAAFEVVEFFGGARCCGAHLKRWCCLRWGTRVCCTQTCNTRMCGGGEVLPRFGGYGFGGGEGVEEGVVLVLGEGAVDVVGGAFVPAGGEVNLVHVDGGGVDDGGDGVVEGEVVGTGDVLEGVGEGLRGERAGGEDGQVGVAVEGEDFFAVDGDVGVTLEALFDAGGEGNAVDCEGVSGGDGAGIGLGEQEAAGGAHLLLEQPGGGVFGLGFKGVGGDEFGEVAGLVGLGGAVRAHLEEVDEMAPGGGLECGFGAGETAADDADLAHMTRITNRCVRTRLHVRP